MHHYIARELATPVVHREVANPFTMVSERSRRRRPHQRLDEWLEAAPSFWLHRRLVRVNFALFDDTFDMMIKDFKDEDDIQALHPKFSVFLDTALARTDLVAEHVKNLTTLRIAMDPSKGTVQEVTYSVEQEDLGAAKIFGPFKAWNAGRRLLQ